VKEYTILFFLSGGGVKTRASVIESGSSKKTTTEEGGKGGRRGSKGESEKERADRRGPKSHKVPIRDTNWMNHLG